MRLNFDKGRLFRLFFQVFFLFHQRKYSIYLFIFLIKYGKDIYLSSFSPQSSSTFATKFVSCNKYILKRYITVFRLPATGEKREEEASSLFQAFYFGYHKYFCFHHLLFRPKHPTLTYIPIRIAPQSRPPDVT